MATRSAQAMLLAVTATAAASEPLDGRIRCAVDGLSDRAQWDVELDARAGRARIDAVPVDAEFSRSHVRLRRKADGATATIGRSSGRLVVVSPDGRVIGLGVCLHGYSL